MYRREIGPAGFVWDSKADLFPVLAGVQAFIQTVASHIERGRYLGIDDHCMVF
jgi:hypothetical protein